jgi:hypothetical protein
VGRPRGLVGGPNWAYRVWPARETLAIGPRHALAAPCPLLASLGVAFVGGGGKGAPFPYIKGPLRRRRGTPRPRVGSSRSSLLYAPLLSPSPPHPPMWLPEGLRKSEGQLHCCTPSCYGNSGFDTNRSTSAASARLEIQRWSSFIVYVRVI